MGEILIKTAYSVDQLPAPSNLEFAIGGRSNVGKSSLINRLFGIKQLAHISSKPGKTASINFYRYSKKAILVDLPGYGFAKQSRKTLSYWGNLIEYYLTNRKTLKYFFLLVDIRRGLQEEEKKLLLFLLSQSKRVLLIFTKLDKLSNNEFSKFKNKLNYELAKLKGTSENFYDYYLGEHFVSSVKNKGIKELKNMIDAYTSSAN